MPERRRASLQESLARLRVAMPSLSSEVAFSSSDILGYARGADEDRATAPTMARPSCTSSRKTKSPSCAAATRLITSYGLDEDDCLGHGR